MQHYFPTHVPTGPFKMPHLSYLASSQWTEVIQQSGSAYRLQFSRFPKVSDSCRFFGPSLPPGCLTVPRCHGNRGSKSSGCDWYAAEVFPNLTPWLSLSLSLASLYDFLSGGLRWWVQPMCLYLSAPRWHSALPCRLIVLTDISPNWGSDMKDGAVQMKAPEVTEAHKPSHQPMQKQLRGCALVSVCGTRMCVCVYVEWVNS